MEPPYLLLGALVAFIIGAIYYMMFLQQADS